MKICCAKPKKIMMFIIVMNQFQNFEQCNIYKIHFAFLHKWKMYPDLLEKTISGRYLTIKDEIIHVGQ